MSNITTPWWIELFDKGALGVDVFLLLSAYGLQCSIEHNTIKRFYKNRLKRLFPLYFLFLLVLFATFEHLCPFPKMVLQTIFQLTGISLFMYADFFSCGFCFDWFTPAIILLYITFPIISKVVKWVEKKDSYYDYLVLVLLVIIGVWIRENKHFSFGLLAIRMPIIYIGILINLYLKHHKTNRLLNICVVAACIGLVSGNEEMRLSLLVLPFLFAFSLTCFQLPFKSFFCLAGRHSYEIYLAHIFPVAFVIPLHFTSNIYLLSIITIIMTALITLLLSFTQSKFWSIVDKFSYR
jgi:peptidoglycan/LPS O-acetylase OafA/YrhL